MSATAALWAALFGVQAVRSVTRPAWAVGLYMLTFFAAPHLWWWGEDIPEVRYALIAGIVLAGAVFLNQGRDRVPSFTFVHTAMLLMAVNAVFVHFAFAVGPRYSLGDLTELLKFALLFMLLVSAIKSKDDMRLVLLAIALGAGYIGYEVTINERGYFSGGRLEGVGAPGADSANSLACLLLLTLPLTGSLLVAREWWYKAAVALTAPLDLNVVILCNSRGTFLALIGSGLSFLLLSRGQTRKNALKALLLGSVVLYLLLGDPEILQRFTTTFSGSEDRDNSAASRLEFWKAGWAMLQDYPLGAGGGAFKYVIGERYLREVVGYEDARSLHNGYLTVATNWGIQGLVLHLAVMFGALTLAYRTSEACRRAGQAQDSMVGICVMVSGISLLIASVFGSFLVNEWGYWALALMVRYSQVYAPVPHPLPLQQPSESPLPSVCNPVPANPQ
jgi:hypothetical protein